jgi:hypothetical protein
MKKYLFSIEGCHYYDDMTYRCDHWKENDYSDLKFEGPILMIRHANMTHFMDPVSAGQETQFLEKAGRVRAAYEIYWSKKLEEAFDLNGE